jgi:methionyl-tRNA formyltransferase
MKIAILTSNKKGTAAYCLPKILKETSHQVVLVIFNEGVLADKKKKYKRIIKKTFKIGFLGAINGIRMRKWYNRQPDDLYANQDIENLCRQNNIRFETTPSINCQKTIELMSSVSADLGLSLGNNYISSKIFSLPVFGMLNIHGEVLPAFQNAQSVIWQLYENSRETGYTIHKIDKKIDTGEIVKQEIFPITFKSSLSETVSITNYEILKRSADGLIDVLNNFDRYYKNAKPQGKGRVYTTPSIYQFIKIYRNFKKLRKNSTLKKSTLG